MGETIAIRGKIKKATTSDKYVVIYVYAKFGGSKLAKYIGKEVSGIVVIEDD